MKNSMIKNALILTIITLVSGLLLGFVYEITKQPIAEAQETAKQEAYGIVFDTASSFIEYEEFDAEEAQSIIDAVGCVDDSIDGVVLALDESDEIIGHVITVTAHDGYGGDITFTLGVAIDGTMNGISILTISETAGLGMKAKEDAFTNQFADKIAQGFYVTKTGSTADNEIDAISGATITSEAVTMGVNAGLVYWEAITGGISYE